MKPPAAVLGIGDNVEFHGLTYNVTSFDGDIAMLAAPGEAPVAVRITALLADATFRILGSAPVRRRVRGPSALFDALPEAIRLEAARLEEHITEVLDGVPCSSEPGQAPRREYDVTRTSLRQRELAKHAELQAAGETLGFSTLQKLRIAYEKRGLLGLVDQRMIRTGSPTGHADPRVVEALQRILEKNAGQSSGSTDRLMFLVGRELEEAHGRDAVAMPSRATFHRLLKRLAAGRHATGSARTRRTLAQQPDGPFGAVYPVRPGELMQIDSTALDVAVELEDGVIGRVELTALVDVATRSIPAAVIRPTTKAVDAALLLARSMTPELMRPGWSEAASMAASALPYRTLKTIDERLAGAAAKPVITPETIVCDHGKAYLSTTFRTACRALGISIQPAHPDTPTDKPVIERTLGSIGTLFAQYVTGYLGSSVERRGKNAEEQAVFSLIEIQDLLDEWIITGWQNRPHDGLRDPFTPGRVLTPNEKYAALVAVSGYVPVPLGPEEYIELLPYETRVINSYGVKIRHRVYDSRDLNPYRGQKSGSKALKDLWEIRYDPYDVSRVWVRNHQDGGWITAFWRQLHSAPQPFGEDVWDQGRRIVNQRGITHPSEETIKDAVDKILDKASPEPRPRRKPGRERRVTARNKAAREAQRPRPRLEQEAPGPPTAGAPPTPDPIRPDGDPALAKVIPLRVYDPQERADEWW